MQVGTQLSAKTKRCFVKDMMLPINVLEEPYFTQRLEALDAHFDCARKWHLLTQMLRRLGENAEQQYAKLRAELCVDIVQAIQATPAYQAWSQGNGDPPQQYNNKELANVGRSIYQPQHLNQSFISIDLVAANFNALRLVSPDIVLGCDAPEELIGRFTEHDYFKHAKRFRQVIFGSLMPSRQRTLWRIQLDNVVSVLREVTKERVVVLSADEVILRAGADDSPAAVNRLRDALATDARTRDCRVRVDAFMLRGIEGPTARSLYDVYYVKEHIYPRRISEFKCVPVHIFIQAYKHYLGQAITEDDLVFFHDGRLARYLDPLF